MQCFKERFSAIIIGTMMIMIMIVRLYDDYDCGTVLCSGFVLFGFVKYYYSAYSWQ